ncbi:hypothetical protein EVAR_39832_1 [Eumeta japonica]|uniref:Uncharacterized protein n=1 Tax=Eumeta variegata TaxID=151549 RepID=A0A4C1XC03_EUMVA|nr:hypothetical protein EVAR_39832_1 [Eumeta japonica]
MAVQSSVDIEAITSSTCIASFAPAAGVLAPLLICSDAFILYARALLRNTVNGRTVTREIIANALDNISYGALTPRAARRPRAHSSNVSASVRPNFNNTDKRHVAASFTTKRTPPLKRTTDCRKRVVTFCVTEVLTRITRAVCDREPVTESIL